MNKKKLTKEEFQSYVVQKAKEFLNEEAVTEKAKSQAQQKFMALVRSVQKGETPKSKVSKKVQKTADSMKSSDVEDFASTKHKGLPKKKKAQKKEETITPDAISQLAEQMGAINKKLAVSDPLISENNIVDEVIKENKRKLKTPMGQEYDIELKDDLGETMLHYNSKKSLNHGKESLNETFGRIMNYKPLSEREDER